MAEIKKMATRDGYGQGLVELGKTRDDIIVMDADLAAATKTGAFKKEFPEKFYNCGIAGGAVSTTLNAFDTDILPHDPTHAVIMIGINDVWHHYAFEFVETTDEQFEANYRCVLDAIKSRTNARILMIQPFLLETVDPAKQELCEELVRKQTIVKRLADEYADAYLPLDEILHAETEEEPAYYAADGVHPTPDGACCIGEAYLGAIAPLIELLS